jgi:murein DD-endopeptidase MepM/ murein hydrolase activator NlpD
MQNKSTLYYLVLSVLISITLFSCGNKKQSDNEEEKKEVVKKEPKMLYGIVVDSLNVVTSKIQSGENLSEILNGLGVSPARIDKIARTSTDTFDVRKIRAGNRYTALTTKDSTEKLQYFIYELSRISYVVYDLTDSVLVYKGKKDITTKKKTATGVISSSLWNAITDNNLDINLALDMSDIYAWTIDFYGLQKGDRFKVIYDEQYVDTQYVGIGTIHAALFNHINHDFYSFYFIQDSIGDYFDEEAQSLRREFLKAPLHFSRISSRFSNSRYHPILKIRRPHHGVDYAAPTGTPVQALGDGKVVAAGRKGGYGKYVKIKHNSVYTTGYAHLSKYGEGINVGTFVKQGQIIGYVGSTGLSTGPHLDFRVYKNGSAIDPLKMESPPAEPVDSIHIESFNKLMKEYKKKLDAIQFPAEANAL